MELLKKRILAGAEALLPELVRLRRHLHMHPELSYAEYETAAFVSMKLKELGIEHVTGIAGTGIVGIIRGGIASGGMTLGLRADMDALPVKEIQGADYRSLNEGVMHACGHDAHTAILLGTAAMLHDMRGELRGNVLLVFQPGEEKAPGGAKLMLESGIFGDYKPDMFIALHVLPDLPTGTVGYHAGPYMASCDEIYITVSGKGGHAAQPSQYTDQIYIASELVLTLKDTVKKMSEGIGPTILGIGRISGMGATNVIPETVQIDCTFRAFDEHLRSRAKEVIHETASTIAQRYGVTIDARIVEGYPVLVNDEALTEKAMGLSRTLLGSDCVREMPVRMSSEDFSFFSERYPSTLFRIGVTSEGQPMKLLHTPAADIDETAMVTGVANMTWLAVNLIAQ
ncbi:MAG TPA: M20 family metallopeptidase [Bacteroidales bacterium]|nr:M20 family metallopeptidase [Bacteroidales bacterium]